MNTQLDIPTAELSAQNVAEAIKQLNHYMQSATAQKQNSVNTLRETFNFGHDYFSMTNGDYTATPIPDFLQVLCKQSIQAFGEKSNLENYQAYQNVIVSIYHPGYHLAPHVDVDISYPFSDGKKVDFCFGENILGVILKADPQGKLFIVETNDEERLEPQSPLMSLDEKAGTVYWLNGKYRRFPYYHGVSAVVGTRISVTFRTVTLL